MKTLAELKTEVELGLHVCAPDGEGGTSYVFRKRGTGPIIHAYGPAPGRYTIYADMRLIKEDEPDYDPYDYENLLTKCAGPARQPVWQTCIIPDELMTQFLAEADEHERWWKKQNAQLMYAILRADRRGQDGEEGMLVEEIPIVDLSPDDDNDLPIPSEE